MKKGKKLLLVLTAVLVSSAAFAQKNTDRIMLGAGALYERGFDATVAWEHETNYHNAWEFGFSNYIKYDVDPKVGHVTKQSFWHNYRTWGGSVAYKPCVIRGRNNHGNVRIAAMLGSDTSSFMGWVSAGYEHDYTLRGSWHLYWQVKSELGIGPARDRFRTGVVIGFKIPTN